LNTFKSTLGILIPVVLIDCLMLTLSVKITRVNRYGDGGITAVSINQNAFI